MERRSTRIQTVRQAEWVYGAPGRPADDDPTETYHEAAKAYPAVIARQVAGAFALESSPELQTSCTRSVKRHAHFPAVELPEPRLPRSAFEDVVLARRSSRSFGEAPLAIAVVAGVLHAAYGVTHRLEGAEDVLQPLRAVPSGGALFPLDLYVVAQRVHDLGRGLYHFDPPRRVLETLRQGDIGDELADASTYPEVVGPSAAVLIVAATFWRSRFKYGTRAYRFVLLEAGHVAQNALLAATAFGLSAVPLGGFYDRRLDGLLGLDGVNESALYMLAIGAAAGGE